MVSGGLGEAGVGGKLFSADAADTGVDVTTAGAGRVGATPAATEPAGELAAPGSGVGSIDATGGAIIAGVAEALISSMPSGVGTGRGLISAETWKRSVLGCSRVVCDCCFEFWNNDMGDCSRFSMTFEVD